MKKLLFAIVFVVALLLSACAPATQGFVQLPDDLRIAITALVVWAVSWLFTQLITKIPFLAFLLAYKEPLAMAIAAILVEAIQNFIPDTFGGIAIIGIQLVLAILALFGVGKVQAARGNRLFM